MDERWTKLCALRIYMQRGYSPQAGFLARMLNGPASLVLARGAKYVSAPSAADADLDPLPLLVRQTP